MRGDPALTQRQPMAGRLFPLTTPFTSRFRLNSSNPTNLPPTKQPTHTPSVFTDRAHSRTRSNHPLQINQQPQWEPAADLERPPECAFHLPAAAARHPPEHSRAPPARPPPPPSAPRPARPEADLHSYMGWWGSFGGPAQKGVTTYALSSNRQNPMAGTAYNAVFNSWRRFKGSALYVIPPFVAYYLMMDWAEKRYARGRCRRRTSADGAQKRVPQQQGGPRSLRRRGGGVSGGLAAWKCDRLRACEVLLEEGGGGVHSAAAVYWFRGNISLVSSVCSGRFRESV